MKKPRMTGALGLGAFFCVTLFFAASFFSCKSVQPPAEEKPEARKAQEFPLVFLLEGDADFYTIFPEGSDKSFLAKILTHFFDQIDLDSVLLACKKFDQVFFSLKDGSPTILAQHSIPKSFLPKIFSQKNGFSPISLKTSENNYEIHDLGDGFSLILLDQNKICRVQNEKIQNLVRDYENLAFYDGEKIIKLSNYTQKRLFDEKKSEIRFFSKNPDAFLKSFIPKQINLPLKCFWGTLFPRANEKFSLNLCLELENPKTMSAAVAMVKLALFPIVAKITPFGENCIMVSDLDLSSSALLKILFEEN